MTVHATPASGLPPREPAPAIGAAPAIDTAPAVGATRAFVLDRIAHRRRARTAARIRRALGVAVLGGLMFGQTSALAIIDAVPTPLVASAMSVGRITSQPIGHYEFCRATPAECRVRSAPAAPGALTAASWTTLIEVNEAVNAAIAPRTDLDMHGRSELWSYPGEAGDCEDYVLLKRRMLMERGFAPGDLLITVVRRPNGEGHAVLTARTDRGDFVLDNLDDEVRDWRATPYRFLKRQSSVHTGRWVDITNGARGPVAVGSVD